MQIEIDQSTLALATEGLLSLKDATGTRVQCRAGSLWITQEGDVRDTVIREGETLTIRKAGRTLIGAIGESKLTLLGPDAPEAATRRRKPRAPAAVSENAPC
ncbi:MAG TPA: DUF2917 domain-containing protein [Burkholderiales bacterium]|nr:DUF2917 domain-containing protein [Burkholderiales bacterium]